MGGFKMAIALRKTISESVFLDPRKNFEHKTVKIEIRCDPLTGNISRIFPFRNLALHRHDWTPFVEDSLKKFCPFCPDVMEKVTPKFTKEIAPEGRIKVGKATVIPNLNPYDKYASLVIMSPRHYIPMEEISTEFMAESIQAGLIYLQRASQADPEGAAYPSINWNYMPYSGGSLIHPHLQILASPKPCTFDKKLIENSVEYYNNYRNNYWVDLIAKEQKLGERYIGKTGNIHWISAFAPRHIAEIIGVLPEKVTINEITTADILNFAKGLRKVISYYNQHNIPSFNAAMYFAQNQDTGFSLHARIVGRFTILPLVGSDITHMQIMHDDPWTVILPEAVAQELQLVF